MKKAHAIILGFLAGLLIVTIPQTVFACTCVEPAPVQHEFDRSKAVFSGKVIEIKDVEGKDGFITKAILFGVNETWKGLDESQVIISTGQGGGDCGIEFIEGEEYLVYATNSKMYGQEYLETTICDRTNRLNASKEDIAQLGHGESPSNQVDMTDEFESNNSQGLTIIGSVLAGVILLGIASVGLYRRFNKK